mgnify:CR=1 FL=1
MGTNRPKIDLLAEHQVVEELADQLMCAAGRSAAVHPAEWIEEVRSRFAAFRTHFIEHMSMEERDGYFADLARRAPQYAVEIDRLYGEHRDFAMIMELIRDLIERIQPDDRLLIRDCKRRIADLMAYLDRHEKDEDLIIMAVRRKDQSS